MNAHHAPVVFVTPPPNTAMLKAVGPFSIFIATAPAAVKVVPELDIRDCLKRFVCVSALEGIVRLPAVVNWMPPIPNQMIPAPLVTGVMEGQSGTEVSIPVAVVAVTSSGTVWWTLRRITT